MRYQLLIFDWDGTLADSETQIVTAMQEAIVELKLPPRSREDIRELIGLGLDDVLRRLYPELELGELRALLDSYRRHWVSQPRPEAPLFPGVAECLRSLCKAGYRLAIATGKSRRGLERSLRHHVGLRDCFVGSRCADETASKPHPRMLEELLAEQAAAPDQALMIGDTSYDMEMAAALGMPAVGVACGVHEGGRLLQARALALLDSVNALPAWLESQGRG